MPSKIAKEQHSASLRLTSSLVRDLTGNINLPEDAVPPQATKAELRREARVAANATADEVHHISRSKCSTLGSWRAKKALQAGSRLFQSRTTDLLFRKEHSVTPSASGMVGRCLRYQQRVFVADLSRSTTHWVVPMEAFLSDGTTKCGTCWPRAWRRQDSTRQSSPRCNNSRVSNLWDQPRPPTRKHA